MILECILEANPLPEITWYRKDKVIKEDARITWECKKGKKNRFLLTLRIKNPTLKDAGMYRCNAFNSSGDSNANIDLKFESKSLLRAELFVNCTGVSKSSQIIFGIGKFLCMNGIIEKIPLNPSLHCWNFECFFDIEQKYW